MPNAIFLDLPSLDELYFTDYLRRCGWRIDPDDLLPFGVIAFPHDADPCSAGYRLADAVISQSERDLRALFGHLEQQRSLSCPPPKEPDAEHPVHNPR